MECIDQRSHPNWHDSQGRHVPFIPHNVAASFCLESAWQIVDYTSSSSNSGMHGIVLCHSWEHCENNDDNLFQDVEFPHQDGKCQVHYCLSILVLKQMQWISIDAVWPVANNQEYYYLWTASDCCLPVWGEIEFVSCQNTTCFVHSSRPNRRDGQDQWTILRNWTLNSLLLLIITFCQVDISFLSPSCCYYYHGIGVLVCLLALSSILEEVKIRMRWASTTAVFASQMDDTDHDNTSSSILI